MAGLKEIKRRLRSVKNTQKITYAMKLVSAAKLRKAQEAVVNSRDYTNELNRLLTQLSAEIGSGSVADDSSHPLLEKRASIKKVGLLVIGGQRGLCGGYNTNVNKKCEAFITQRRGDSVEVSSILMGKKPGEYYRRRKHSYIQAYEELPESAGLWPVEEVARALSDRFVSGEVDEVWVIYTRFRSAISQQVQLEKLLPLDPNLGGVSSDSPSSHSSATQGIGGTSTGVTLFEPSISAVFSALMPRILSAKIRQFCLDAKASETAARMTTMDSATKNAKQLGRKLELQHNKIRQARITSELLDIIGGAEAVQ